MDQANLKPEAGKLSYCETGNALKGPWHLRRLTAKGYRFGGGADSPALCGREVRWDLQVPVTDDRLANDEITCRKCREAI